ncbi:MAG TPA: hypothetical protein VGM90_11710 [Kofleriaceae bacterium]|jgi:hypothetical protein
MFRLVAASLATLVACGQSRGVADQDLGDLVVAKKDNQAPIKAAKAAREPAELSRALEQPLSTVLVALGPHTATLDTKTTVEEAGQAVSDLADSTKLELGDKGAFHAVYTNTADYGREAIFVDGKMYLRPRYQKWHGRAPEGPNEPAQQRDTYYDAVEATWDLLAPGVELIDKGPVTIAGRPGRKIQVARAPKPAANPAEKLTQRKWREQRVIEDVSGEVVLDEEKAVPLSVQLAGTISFMRDGRRFKMKTSVTELVASLGPAAITAPAAEDVIATPERLREVDDRDMLLQGIAPPTHKQESGAVGSAGTK